MNDMALPFIDAAAVPTLAWSGFELPNGLRVVVHEDRAEPRVHVGMNYRVGSKDETVGADSGFAHLFEHLMFGGTERLPGPYVDRLKQAGALDVNGETSHDSTRFHQLVHTGMLEFTLYAEADRMAHLGTQLRQEVLDQQREIVLMEKSEREGAPMGRLPECVSRGLFPTGHPYRHTVIGEEDDLRAATLASARAWAAQHYVPSNAVLVLVGDVGVDDARAMATRHFGAIPPGPPLFRPGRWVPASQARRRDQLDDPRIDGDILHAVWITANATDPRADAIALALRLWTEGRPSRLAEALVRDGGPVRDVAAHALSEQACGQVAVTLRLAPGAAVDEAERELRTAVARLGAAAPDAAALDRLVHGQLRELGQVAESLAGKAMLLTNGALLFDDPGASAQVARQWLRLRPDDVRAATAECFGAEPYLLHVRRSSHAGFVATGRAPREVPTVQSTPFAPPALHADRGSAGPQVTTWHTPGPVGTRLVLRLIFDRGLTDLPAAERPLAALLASLPRLALGGRDAAAHAAWLDAAGLRLHGRCDGSTVQLQVEGPVASTAQAGEWLADVVGWAGAGVDTDTDTEAESHVASGAGSVQQAAFDHARQQALTQWRAAQADPVALAASLPRRALLGAAHPLVATPGDAVRALDGATLKGTQALHRRLFDPRLAMLVAVGGVAPAVLRTALDRAWSGWSAPAGPPLARAAPPRVPARAPTAPVDLVDAGQGGQAQLFGACLLPPFSADEGWPLAVLVDILGGGLASRLSSRLRDGLNLTYGVHAGIEGCDRPDLPRLLVLHTAVDPARAGAALREIVGVLHGLSGDAPPTADEVAACQRDRAQHLPNFAREPAEVCEALALQCRHALPPTHWSESAQALRRLIAADVQALARSLLIPARFRWSLAGDARTLAGQLAACGFEARVQSPHPAGAGPAPAASNTASASASAAASR